MFEFTTENVLNDLSRVSVIDDSVTLTAPASPSATKVAGGALTAGAYYYKITALNAQGETTGSTEVTATTETTNLQINLAWTAVTGATSYRVYRGTTTGAENQYFTVTTNSYSDASATAGTTGTVPTTNTAYVDTDPGVPSGDKALFIKRLNKFLNSNTSAVYKNPGYAPVKEIATIAIPTGTYTAGVYRFHLDVIMSGSYPITYDRWAINKGKPFYVEVLMPAEANATAFATDFAAGVTKGLIKFNGEIITDLVVTASGTNVIVTAANEYQRFKYLAVENFVLDPVYSDTYDFSPLIVGATTTSGIEGFGTSWYLTKNVRIPTQEATRFFGEDQDERPVIGVQYDQYTLKYSAQRNIGSLDYVGGLGVSNTDHVLWIPHTLASTFDGYLTTVFGSKLQVVNTAVS